MSTAETKRAEGREQVRALVSAYHQGWSEGRFAQATEALAPSVEIEVPVNAYPDRASFAVALAAFGAMVERVSLLSALFDDEQAMLLYDMDVRGVGAMRVAEHFTVRDGQIVKLRQIHDTAAVRAAGLVADREVSVGR